MMPPPPPQRLPSTTRSTPPPPPLRSPLMAPPASEAEGGVVLSVGVGPPAFGLPPPSKELDTAPSKELDTAPSKELAHAPPPAAGGDVRPLGRDSARDSAGRRSERGTELHAERDVPPSREANGGAHHDALPQHARAHHDAPPSREANGGGWYGKGGGRGGGRGGRR